MTKSAIRHVFLFLLLLLLLTISVGSGRRVRRQNRSHQLLASFGMHAQRYDTRHLRNGGLQYTNIDLALRQLMLLTRRTTLRWALQNMDTLQQRNEREGKMQAKLSRRVPFPCALNDTRSRQPPTSVERLRPGDIDVIAAIGDSLSAGNGIMSSSAIDMINEFRGLTFSGGGMADWRQYLTLPNILKVFNPQLYGFAVGNSLVANHRMSRLNIAEPMILAHDLPFQAHVLIDLMRRDTHIDMQRHWKLLTVYVGNNDICSDMCHWDSAEAFLARQAHDLRQAFALLRDNVPRLLINLVVVPNLLVTLSGLSNVPFQCYVVHRLGCPCLMNDRLSAQQRQQYSNTIQRLQQIELSIAQLPEFQREDFAIIAHPMIANASVPRAANGQTDWRYFGHDCFHFSQRGHALLSNMLWNSMLLPDEQKPRMLNPPFERFLCPTQAQPYLVTRASKS